MTANSQEISERSIFLSALEQNTPAQREAYLAAACGEDASLRRRVAALLHSHDNAASFFGKLAPERIAEELAAGLTADAQHDATHGPGTVGNVLHFLAPSSKPGSLGRLGSYDVEEVIGSGGMGIVLLAFDEKLHRSVAIKVMSATLATNEHARRRFVREGRAAAAIRDDHVIGIHGVDEVNGLPFLVMEYIVGQSLAQRIEAAGPLPLADILRIGGQIARGLAAAHAQGVVHRDIKPANILLENGIERVKITDFGLAHAVDDVRTTQPGTVVGTPEYMSPEQARGERVDHRSDLFSLGCVLYAMCAGRPPFRAESTVAIIRRVCEDSPRPLCEVNADVPNWLADIIDRLIAKAPDERFQTAGEVAQLLEGCLAHLQQHGISAVPAILSGVGPIRSALNRQRADSVPGTKYSVLRQTLGNPKSPALRHSLAATILLMAALALAETTGVTSVAATVIRIVRGDGTLVVEIDDPNIQVLVDGEELVINGAGPKEIRLRPGQHELQSVQDGKPVETKLITITREGREVVKVAREAPPTTSAAGPSTRLVWDNANARPNSTSISLDGRFLAYAGSYSGDLVIRDLATGKDRRLTNEGSSPETKKYADGPRFSPDGTQLAYTWTEDDFNYDLRTIAVAGGEPRIVYSNKKDRVYPEACGWTPDGQAILVKLNLGDDPPEKAAATAPPGLRRSQLVLIAAKDASIRVIKSFEYQRGTGEGGRRHLLAPDGRTIAHSRTVDAASGRNEIFLLDVETGVETQITKHGADKSDLAWTPDGRQLLFDMQREGAQDAWLIRIVNGQPRGEPELAKRDIGQIEPVGLTRAGALYYGTLIREPNLSTATLNWEKGTVAVTTLAAEQFNIQSAFRLGDWSPDGEHLAYWAQARQPRTPEMKIVSLKTGQTRTLSPELSLRDPNIYFRWSPDGRSFIATGNALAAETSVIYQIDALSGKATKVVEHGGAGQPGWNRLCWSHDGQGIFYFDNRPKSARQETLRLVYRNLQTQTEKEVLPQGDPFGKRSTLLEPSPDGRHLALFGNPTADSLSLSLLPLDGKPTNELFRWNTPRPNPQCLAWTPDGRFVLFTRRESNKLPDLWYLSAAGGQAQKLVRTGARKDYYISRLRMHPDGKQLAISHLDGVNRELWALEKFLPPTNDAK